jgi:1-acyl-sn-glycerol-3-phosphate acyltransferase
MKKIVSVISRAVLGPYMRSHLVREVVGAENVPAGNFILASNHLSHLDYFVHGFLCTPRRFTYIGQVDKLTKGPIRFWRDMLYAYAEVIPVDRRDSTSKKAAIEKAEKMLKDGYCLIIFPEGTRSLDGKLHDFRPGVARFHLNTGVPILPVALKGTYELMPPGSKLKIERKVVATFGKPLDFPGERRAAAKMDKKSDEYRELCVNITKKVEGAVRELLS